MSVVLDTNVVSELIRRSPDPAVKAWVADHALEDLYFSADGPEMPGYPLNTTANDPASE